MESNDSPEIPDRGKTSDIPGLPSGDLVNTNTISANEDQHDLHMHIDGHMDRQNTEVKGSNS